MNKEQQQIIDEVYENYKKEMLYPAADVGYADSSDGYKEKYPSKLKKLKI